MPEDMLSAAELDDDSIFKLFDPSLATAGLLVRLRGLLKLLPASILFVKRTFATSIDPLLPLSNHTIYTFFPDTVIFGWTEKLLGLLLTSMGLLKFSP